MPKFLTQLTKKDLHCILVECQDFKSLQTYLTDHGKKSGLNEIHDDADSLKSVENYSSSRAFLLALEVSSIPVDFYWFLISFVDLDEMAAGVGLAILIASFFIGVGSYFYTERGYSYQSILQW